MTRGCHPEGRGISALRQTGSSLDMNATTPRSASAVFDHLFIAELIPRELPIDGQFRD
jgi:hypothetical protein